jgi:hypothetical protein
MRFPPLPVSAYDVAMKRALVLLVLVLLACSKTKSNALPPEAWGVSDYESAGIDIDKPWTDVDFVHAANVLAQVTAGHRERLPRYRGAKSGAVFAKLIESLPPDDDKPIGERFIVHSERSEAANQTSKLYLENAYAVPTREWIELMGVVLREATMLTSNTDAFLASLGPDDPQRETRLQGLAKMHTGYGTMLLGGLLVAGDARVREADRVALVKYVTAAIPVLFPPAPGEMQTQIRDQAMRLVEKLPEGELRTAVIAAQAALP